jgi:DNA-directed RNA polymerase specialized sigma subunit
VFLDDVIKREAEQKLADTLLVEQVKLLEAAELALRRRLEREPTALELAAALEWTPEVVEAVGAVLHRARDLYDSEIVDYLDDVDESDVGDTPDI